MRLPYRGANGKQICSVQIQCDRRDGACPRPFVFAETLYRLRRYRTAARAVPTVCVINKLMQISRADDIRPYRG